jgi:PPOX class probable F420-dependent enzyme
VDGLNLPRWARELIEAGRVGHLGLLDDRGAPRVLPVTYVVWEGAAWSAVDDKPKRRPGAELARVRFARARPAAALTVDRYSDDWGRLAWVQLHGRAEVWERAEPGLLEALAVKYESYRARPPRGPCLRVVPERASCWRAAGNNGA